MTWTSQVPARSHQDRSGAGVREHLDGLVVDLGQQPFAEHVRRGAVGRDPARVRFAVAEGRPPRADRGRCRRLGVRRTFREYVTGDIAQGEWTLSAGAEDGGALFRFPGGSGTYEDGDLTAAFTGAVRFTGAHGLDLRLSADNSAFTFTDGTGGYDPTAPTAPTARRARAWCWRCAGGVPRREAGARGRTTVPSRRWCLNAGVTDYDVLRVFCAANGGYGNELGVVRDGSVVPGRSERQAFAAKLGFSETVFVDDPERGVIDIYTPGARLPFAGHPCVGAAWLLDVPELVTPAGVVGARQDGEFSWIEARPEWPEPRTLRRYATPAEVDALPVPPPWAGERPTPWVYAWAWEDEAAGRVRARGFPGRGDGIVEDEATGAAALLLTARLDRALNIAQGAGSQILTAPQPEGWVEIGGRVLLER